jgi:diguanylate cyclase (GGDEF)-like protein/PAS domain S-box-containing protein
MPGVAGASLGRARPDGRTAVSRTERRVHLALTVIATALLGWYSTASTTGMRTLASHVLFIVLPLGAAVSCWSTARRRTDRRRLSWRLMSAGAMSWALASVIWAAYLIATGHQAPFPSIADAFYLLSPALIAIGLLLAPVYGTRTWLLRSLVDAAMALAALWVIAWPLEFGHAFDANIVGTLVSFGYPAVDLFLVVAAAALWLRVRGPNNGAGRLLLAMAVCQGATDGYYGVLSTTGSYATGQQLDVGWFASFTLLGLAARASLRDGGARPSDVLSVGTQLFPLVPVGAALLSLAVSPTSERLVSTLGVAFVLGAGLLREWLLARDHARLARGLEEEVGRRSEQLAEQERQYASLVRNSSDVIAVVERDGVVSFVSDAAVTLFGVTPRLVVGRTLGHFVHPQDLAALLSTTAHLQGDETRTVEVRLRHATGTWVDTECRLRGEPNGQVLANIRDISARRSLEQKLRAMALRDSVTGLASRSALLQQIEIAASRKADVSLLFCDLDDFKNINDTAGHATGDQALRDVAERLRATCPPTAVLARLGGDEFAVLLTDTSDADQAVSVAESIVTAVARPLRIGDRMFVLGASVGVATGAHGPSSSDLLRHADLAMYDAKNTGKGRVSLFSEALAEAAVNFADLHSRLITALEHQQFEPHYQPIVDVSTGALSGFEALARWRHPDHGLLTPAAWLPVAEQTGLVVNIGQQILATSCAQLASWRGALAVARDLTMSVNIDPQQLTEDLLDTTMQLLAAHELPASALVFEITEGEFAVGAQAMNVLAALSAIGIGLAVDDFGTGYSSLSRLHEVKIDRVKIDRSFISQIRSATQSAPLTSTALAMCQALQVEAVAEGVETPEQLAFLQAAGCSLAQGYLFSEPLSALDATELVGSVAGQARPGSPAASAVATVSADVGGGLRIA